MSVSKVCGGEPSTTGPPQFKWEILPLEVYENLVKYFDGRSLLNMCLLSPRLTQKVLEPFDVMPLVKQEQYWQNFCLRHLDRSVMTKIFRSFVDFKKIQSGEGEGEKGIVCQVSWTNVFRSYVQYWKLLTSGDASNQRLLLLENKLKAELLCAQASLLPEKRERTDYKYRDYRWITHSVGGNLVLSVMFPCPTDNVEKLNMVVSDPDIETVRIRFLSPICFEGEFFLGLKIIDFLNIRDRENGDGKSLDIERVVIGACDKCITLAPLLGGTTRKLEWPQEEVKPEYALRWECPVFEVHNHVIAIWSLPESLIFFLVDWAQDHDGFRLCLMYRVPFTGERMRKLWKDLSKNPLLYLPCIEEFTGSPERMNPRSKAILARQENRNFQSQTDEPFYFGLTLISPINGSIVMKPPASPNEAVVRSKRPQYDTENVCKYLDEMRKPTCFGKGKGLYVFCSATAIAISWNRVSWTFGELKFPTLKTTRTESQQNVVSHVAVTHYDNGLLLVINEDIVLAKVTVEDSELKVKPLRHFMTGLATMGKEISQIELDFENGFPFFLVMAKGKRQEMNTDEVEEHDKIMRRVDFSMLRLYFKNQGQ